MAADSGVVEDRGIVLDSWIRSGGCHDRCGACCEFIMIPLAKPYIDHGHDSEYADWKRWLKLHRIEIVGNKAKVSIPCVYLGQHKQCIVHGTDVQPRMCVEGPRLPSEITGLEDICTYSWRRVNG